MSYLLAWLLWICFDKFSQNVHEILLGNLMEFSKMSPELNFYSGEEKNNRKIVKIQHLDKKHKNAYI